MTTPGLIVVTAPDDKTIEVLSQGPQGIPGPAGPDGPQGPAGDVNTLGYVHTQGLPASTWTIVHNLGYHPAGVVVIDSANSNVEGEISYPSINVIVLVFSSEFSGTAYLS